MDRGTATPRSQTESSVWEVEKQSVLLHDRPCGSTRPGIHEQSRTDGNDAGASLKSSYSWRRLDRDRTKVQHAIESVCVRSKMNRRHLRNAIWIFAEDTRIMGWENVFAFPLQLSQSRHCVRHVIQEAGRDLFVDIHCYVHCCVAADDRSARLRRDIDGLVAWV